MDNNSKQVCLNYRTNEGYEVVVLKKISSDRLLIEFQDNYRHRREVDRSALRIGSVKNPFHRRAHGVGFIGVGKFLSSKNGKPVKEYKAWVRMIERCYSNKLHDRYPTYKNCTVHPDWHDYQAFAKWYTSQKYYDLDYALDKDLLVRGNKVYSEDNCCLLPAEINGLVEKLSSVSAIKIAAKWRGHINDRVYHALMNWTVADNN